MASLPSSSAAPCALPVPDPVHAGGRHDGGGRICTGGPGDRILTSGAHGEGRGLNLSPSGSKSVFRASEWEIPHSMGRIGSFSQPRTGAADCVDSGSMVATDRRVAPRSTAPVGAPRWVFGAAPDLLMALSWVPVFVAWHVIASGSGAGADHRIQQGMVLALLISFLHQPLTLGLVYGDSRQIALHRRLFLWAPVVAVGVAVLAAARNWWIVVPVAAVWNLQHTLQQRYGVQRIYSGRSGYGSARMDRAVAYVPMAAVLLAVAAMPTTTSLVRRSGLDPRNAQGVDLLVRLRPVAAGLLVLALIATGFVVAAVVGQEIRAGDRGNRAKWLYQGSSLALLASIAVDPIAGFIAYVTAHAVEYAVIVDRTARRRYSPGAGSDPGIRQTGVAGAGGDQPPGTNRLLRCHRCGGTGVTRVGPRGHPERIGLFGRRPPLHLRRRDLETAEAERGSGLPVGGPRRLIQTGRGRRGM